MSEDTLSKQYDAIVVGSGATGGWAAKRLSEAGLQVLLLEAGRAVSPEEFREHVPPYKLAHRNMTPEIARTRPIQRMCYACNEYNYNWFVNDLENPYSTPEDKPFTWQRLRILGGRTLVWYRQSYRMSPQDFQAARYDGYGENWPFGYEELAPYYDEVEGYVGVSGQAENHPALPDGDFLPPMSLTCGEELLREKARERFGWTLTIGRSAVLTRDHNGRAACHYCGPCERGCMTFSYFSSPFTTVQDALETGNCTLRTDSVVSHVDMDDRQNRARGVTFVDRLTHRTFQARARVVLLCAQSLESTRILLNSSTRVYSDGLANSSGVLGRYLMDHVVGAGASGELTGLKFHKSAAGPNRPNGIYVIRFQNLEGMPQERRFIRGYGIFGSSEPHFYFDAEGFGADYKERVKEGLYGVFLKAYGESLPRLDNYCEIDPDLRDAWGIPALRIVMSHGPNERAMMEDGAVRSAELLESVGARNIVINSDVAMPGMAIHEVGTARMGKNPSTSVLDPFNMTHDVPNLGVLDGSCFVTSGCQNPTLTMMALAVRACDRLIEKFRRSEV